MIDPATLLANDSDENGDLIFISEVERFPDNGKVRIRPDGMIEFVRARTSTAPPASSIP